tara:strand:- start:501 stop:695 length:195 start_codon:yes stop_codon:yes gene_type:complete
MVQIQHLHPLVLRRKLVRKTLKLARTLGFARWLLQIMEANRELGIKNIGTDMSKKPSAEAYHVG